MCDQELRRKIGKFAELLDEAFRAVAHLNAIDRYNFRNDSDLSQTKITIKNSLIEIFIIKWHVLFSIRDHDHHRIWTLGNLGNEFRRTLDDRGILADFEQFSENVSRIRDMVVAHVDSFERIQELNRQGGHWPNMNNALRYLVVAYDILPGRSNGVHEYQNLEGAASRSFDSLHLPR